jgi:hypothetical protein
MKGRLNNMEAVGTEPEFRLCPEGQHLFQITEIASDRVTKNDDPLIRIKLEVVSGQHKGSYVYDNIIISNNPESPSYSMRWRAKQFLKAIDQAHHGDNFEWDSDYWAWKKCLADIKHEPIKAGKLKGKTGAIVIRYDPPPSNVGIPPRVDKTLPPQSDEHPPLFDDDGPRF